MISVGVGSNFLKIQSHLNIIFLQGNNGQILIVTQLVSMDRRSAIIIQKDVEKPLLIIKVRSIYNIFILNILHVDVVSGRPSLTQHIREAQNKYETCSNTLLLLCLLLSCLFCLYVFFSFVVKIRIARII